MVLGDPSLQDDIQYHSRTHYMVLGDPRLQDDIQCHPRVCVKPFRCYIEYHSERKNFLFR